MGWAGYCLGGEGGVLVFLGGGEGDGGDDDNGEGLRGKKVKGGGIRR